MLAVPKKNVDELAESGPGEDVEATVIGTFGGQRTATGFEIYGPGGRQAFDGVPASGIPMPTRKAVIVTGQRRSPARVGGDLPGDVQEKAAGGAGASEHRQQALDHPAVRPRGAGRVGGEAAGRARGKWGHRMRRCCGRSFRAGKGWFLGCGMAPQIEDPYEMALASIDEAIRNVVAVGRGSGSHGDSRQFLLAERG